MKKIFKYLAVAASVAALAVACEKAQTGNQNVTPEENTPGEVTYDSAKYLLGFSASFEITKADLDDASGAISWSNGDKVKVFNTDGESALYVYNGTDFEPDGTPLEKNGNEMKACFPADKFSWVTDHVQFTMPEAFQSLTGIQNPMAGIVPADADATTSVELKNLGGIFEVKLSTAKPGTDQVTKLELGNSGVALTGSATLSFNGEIPAIGALDGEKSVTLEFASPLVLDNTPQSVFFFLPVSDALSDMYVKAIFGKAVGEVTYEPSERKTRKSDMNITRGGRWNMTFSVNGFFSGGDGSETNPYQIASVDDFKRIATLANATAVADGNGYNDTAKRTFFGSAGVHYKQTADIDFNNDALTPIGVYNATAADATPFQGVYDGDGKTLSKFTVTGTQAASTGLFEYVSDATLKNIAVGTCSVTGENVTGILTGRCIGTTTIEGCSLTGPANVQGRNSVGFIAHITGSTTVKNCTVSNITVITAASGADANNQGGVVGFAGGASSIESCSTSGTIQFTGTASGAARGGIVGKLDSTGEVKECTNDADITSVLVNYTGGIAGQLTNGTITGCVNTGDVTGLGYVGGITGAMLPASSKCVFVNKCRVNAVVKGTGDENTEACVGGIVGSMQNGVLNTCIAKGSVENSWYDTGGIAGQIYANGASAVFNRPYVFDCIAANDVKCTRTSGSSNIGGVVGRINRNGSYTDQYTAVDNCIGLNQTITASIQYAGAFVGNVNASATNNNRVRVRNCISLVEDSNLQVNTSANYTGGFAGSYLGALIHCYYLVSDNNQTAVGGTTAANNLTKSDLTTLTSPEFCSAHSTRATGYNLTVNGTQYKSSGWTLPSDASYPVPTTLYNLGSEYYK